MKKIFALMIIALTCKFCVKAQIGIAASPMRLDFNTAAGSNQTAEFTVSNPSKEVMDANISFADWNRDSTGDIVYFTSSTLPSSCSDWIKVFPSTSFSLKPGERKNFSVILTVPENGNMDKVKNSMIFLTQLNTQPATTNTGLSIKLAVRMGIQVFYTPAGLNKKEIDITGFTESTAAKTDSANAKILTLVLENKGDLVADGKINFELTDLNTGKKTELPEMKFYSLPGAVRSIQLPLSKGLADGKYSVSALVDYGEDQELKIAELEFLYERSK